MVTSWAVATHLPPQRHRGDGSYALAPPASGSFTLSTLVGDSLPRIVRAGRITEDFLWLKGVHPDYLARFPEFPGVKD